MSEKAEGGLPTSVDIEQAFNKALDYSCTCGTDEYCRHCGYWAEATRLVSNLEKAALRSLSPEREETQQTLLDDVIEMLEEHDCKAAAKAVRAAKKRIPDCPVYRGLK